MVLEEEVKRNTIIYVDDCLCYYNSLETHLAHLELLLDNLRKANLTINLEKSQFFRQEISYLGYRPVSYTHLDVYKRQRMQCL